MRASFAIAALVGTAIAAPSYGYQPEKEVKYVEDVHLVVETVVETIYVTEGPGSAPTPTPQPVYQPPVITPIYEAPAVPSSKYEAPAYTPAPAPQPEPEQPKPTPTPAPAPQPPTSNGYMGVVQEWRAKLGLKELTYDTTLESNARDCAAAGNGQMVHKLNPGTYAQVLAPMKEGAINDIKEFTHVFLGGWLCELPDLPGLDGVCETQSEGWTYQGQTGHAEILTSGSYSKIGCAEVGGICSCDLA